jgi:hypothetical protein
MNLSETDRQISHYRLIELLGLGARLARGPLPPAEALEIAPDPDMQNLRDHPEFVKRFGAAPKT